MISPAYTLVYPTGECVKISWLPENWVKFVHSYQQSLSNMTSMLPSVFYFPFFIYGGENFFCLLKT